MSFPRFRTVLALLPLLLPPAAVGGDSSAGKMTPWDVEGMFAQAWTILEDKTIQNVSGVPAMLETCAAADYIPAQRLLLDVYEGRFKGLSAKPEKAALLARTLAEAPVAADETEAARNMRIEAAFRYALYLEKGYGCTKNPTEAYRWMRKAGNSGLSKARVEAARYLINGIGHARNPRTALMLLAEQARTAPETPNLFYYLGHICLRGIGMRRPNKLMALRFFEKGATLNDPNATNNLATMYEQGIVVSQDRSTALRLYRRAADLGSKEASVNMQRLAFKTNVETDVTTTTASQRVANAVRRVISVLPVSEDTRRRFSAPFLPQNNEIPTADL